MERSRHSALNSPAEEGFRAAVTEFAENAPEALGLGSRH